jgi:hypothetical protein
MSDDKDKHKASLDEMLQLLEHTLKLVRAYKPKAPEARRDIALRRWAMTLGALMLNVGRSISRLIDTDDVVTVMILSRSMYEYRLKTQYFLKDNQTRRLAFDQFMTIVTAFVQGLRRLPTITEDIDDRLTASHNAWIASGGKEDPYSGKRAVTTMAIELAQPGEVLKDDKGNEYTHQLTTSYHIPSWFAHGSAPVVGEFFPKWYDDADMTFQTTPLHHNSVLVYIRGVISEIFQYIFLVRKRYDIEMFSLKQAVERSKLLQPPEIRRQMEEKYRTMQSTRNRPKDS